MIPSERWTEVHAEAHLRSLELFGMRFGLERMRRMMTALGSPQRRFDSIHVLGTNGKSSTTRMTAAILRRHGLRTGAYTSPHLVAYRERVQIDGEDLDGEAFAAAVARAVRAAEHVNRTLAEDDHVTQFELLTAAALWAMAEHGVQVAVIEAGLGGRYDATSVIESPLSALTNVGLEHTRWLGPTLSHIAGEKLAALSRGATLVLGADVATPAVALAAALPRERGVKLRRAEADSPGTQLLAKGDFQRRNFALARALAEQYLASAGVVLSEGAVREAAALTEVRGRLQVVGEDPLTVFDGAHNPHAAAALAESLPGLLGGRSVALVLGVLEDKDAIGVLSALLGSCESAWFTAPPSPRALPPAALESLARQLGFRRAHCEPSAERALGQALRWARERAGAVLATGSVYLVGELLVQISAPPGALGQPTLRPGAQGGQQRRQGPRSRRQGARP